MSLVSFLHRYIFRGWWMPFVFFFVVSFISGCNALKEHHAKVLRQKWMEEEAGKYPDISTQMMNFRYPTKKSLPIQTLKEPKK